MATFEDYEGILLGMGNPLLDISSDVPEETLKKYDVELNSACLAEEKHMPVYDELVEMPSVEYIAGGATLNSIRVAQWMSGIPNATGYFGAVGKDATAKILKDCLNTDGVKHNFFEADVPTGRCAVLINGGERSLIADISAANHFKPGHLSTQLSEQMLQKAQFYYIASFFLTVSVESLEVMAKHAVENGKIFMMNLSAPFLIEFFKDQMSVALPYTDYVFANESEAETFGRVYGWGLDIKEIAKKLAALPKASGTRPRTVIFTQGKDPTIVAREGVVLEFPVEPLPQEKLIDTNGAGDAFVGGFLSQLIKGRDLKKCIDAGNFAARVIIQNSGCSFPSQCDYED